MQQDTSLSAYYKTVKPTLGNRQKVVFEKLREKPNWTNCELAKALDWPINTLVPRVNELRKMELVEEAGRRVCAITKFMVHSWRVKSPLVPVFRQPETEVEVYSSPRQATLI